MGIKPRPSNLCDIQIRTKHTSDICANKSTQTAILCVRTKQERAQDSSKLRRNVNLVSKGPASAKCPCFNFSLSPLTLFAFPVTISPLVAIACHLELIIVRIQTSVIRPEVGVSCQVGCAYMHACCGWLTVRPGSASLFYTKQTTFVCLFQCICSRWAHCKNRLLHIFFCVCRAFWVLTLCKLSYV